VAIFLYPWQGDLTSSFFQAVEPAHRRRVPPDKLGAVGRLFSPRELDSALPGELLNPHLKTVIAGLVIRPAAAILDGKLVKSLFIGPVHRGDIVLPVYGEVGDDKTGDIQGVHVPAPGPGDP